MILSVLSCCTENWLSVSAAVNPANDLQLLMAAIQSWHDCAEFASRYIGSPLIKLILNANCCFVLAATAAIRCTANTLEGA